MGDLTIMQTFMTKFSLQSGKGEGTTVRMEKNFGDKAGIDAR